MLPPSIVTQLPRVLLLSLVTIVTTWYLITPYMVTSHQQFHKDMWVSNKRILFPVANYATTKAGDDKEQLQGKEVPVAGELDQVEAVSGGGGGHGGGEPPAAGLYTTDG